MRFRKVALGGTFETIHRGHRALLERAFEAGDFVIIGLTSNKMLDKEASPYRERYARLKDNLEKCGHKDFEIVMLNDKYGPASLEDDIDAIVVSEETLPNANEINRIREMNNLAILEIIILPLVLAEDKNPISSTRILKGEIDAEGRIL